jgi:putative sterol carrier protein
VAPLAATRLTEDVLPPDLVEHLDPEWVAPLVLYLCSNQCTDSGLILNAGMGFFSRAAVVSGPGVLLGEEEQPPTIGEVHQNWARIERLAGAQEYADANAALMDMLTGPREVPEEEGERRDVGAEARSESPSVQAIFDQMPDFFQPGAAAGVDVTFQFNISGPGGGDWTVAVKDGQCTVDAGVHGSPNTTLKMADEDFVALVEGRLPAMQAYTSGKLKIEGDLMKSQLVERLFKF